MKFIALFIGVVSIWVFTSCGNSKTVTSQRILLHNYDQDTNHVDKIWRSDSIHFVKTTKNDTSYFLYSDSISTSGFLEEGLRFYYFFTKPPRQDSLIYFDKNTLLPLVGTKTFTINQQKFKILKYYYNLENSAGEESNFFYHPNYGLLVVYNEGCFSSLVHTMEYDQISKTLVDSIIQDRTGFYSVFEKGDFRSIPNSLIDEEIEIELDIELSSDSLYKVK